MENAEKQRATVKPILVGEANPYGGDPRYALYPEPEYSAGGRLCRLIMGLDPREYLRRFDRRNLCAGKWGSVEARETAAAIGREVSMEYHLRGGPGRVVVLLGSKVCSAFGVRFEPFTALAQGDCGLVLLPHPSGLCRLWHEPDAINRARRTLRAAGIDFVAPAL